MSELINLGEVDYDDYEEIPLEDMKYEGSLFVHKCSCGGNY